MLDSLTRMIKRPSSGSMRPGRVEIAAAALLVEFARLGENVGSDERVAISDIVRGRFLLSPPAAEALVALAERREDEPYSDWSFAETIKSAFDIEERRKLLRHIHLVATTDAVLAKTHADLMPRLVHILALSPDDVVMAASKSNVTKRERQSAAS